MIRRGIRNADGWTFADSRRYEFIQEGRNPDWICRSIRQGGKYKDTFVIDLTPKGGAFRDLFQQVPGLSGKSLLGGAMTSPERRDLLPSGSRSFGADLGMLLSSQALGPSVKRQLGCCQQCGGMMRPKGT